MKKGRPKTIKSQFHYGVLTYLSCIMCTEGEPNLTIKPLALITIEKDEPQNSEKSFSVRIGLIFAMQEGEGEESEGSPSALPCREKLAYRIRGDFRSKRAAAEAISQIVENGIVIQNNYIRIQTEDWNSFREQ